MAQKDATKLKISKFIDAISDKNYAVANKYLQSAVNDKLEARIKQAAEKPLF
jgi:SLT domain-containing protein|tara:strand:- start:1717 stop:1872 length:156 start_codon:yes stop_codon:yes gene_type:complete